MASKQVLVMRNFGKNFRKGKYCAQAAHASLGAVFGIGHIEDDCLIIPLKNPFVREWITGRFTKIAVYVETEAELIEIHAQAQQLNVATTLIRDSGITEFNGVPTLTAVGIGPDDSELIDTLTRHLPLF